MRVNTDALSQPIPEMSALRATKATTGYRHLPLDTTDPRYDEPLVAIHNYTAGQGYYSRPNGLTGDPIPGAPRDLYLRRSVAEQLGAINDGLRHPAFTEFFGCDVELYVEDAWRHPSLQQQLWNLFLEELLRKGIDRSEAEQRRSQLIAAPNIDTSSPHRTGGAFDVVLRRMDSCLGFVPDTILPLGFRDAELSDRLQPDYYELAGNTKDATDFNARRNRRALYAILTGNAFGIETGFRVNPNEVFHWGIGDLLWALCTGKAAFYGAAEPPA